MKVFNAQMRQALIERGFVEDRRPWRLDREALSLLIYDEKAVGAEYGIGVFFGGPAQPVNRDGSYAVLQVGQRFLAGERSFYYDFSRDVEKTRCERDFFLFTLPLIDRFVEPKQLVGGILRGEVPSALYRDAAGPAKAALDVARAYGLGDVTSDIEEFLRKVSQDREVYEGLVSVARDWPDRFPELGALMQHISPPPAAPRRLRNRWFGR